MLLGIGLHAALSFKPAAGVWMIHDSSTNEAFAVFESLVHGFRMPLFFLISGFFTAMLWRKRGLASLIKHRFKRIFVPLLIGMFTIIPAIFIATFACFATGIVKGGPNGNPDSVGGRVWAAATNGNVEDLQDITAEDLAEAEFDVNAQNPMTGSTPLVTASALGHADVAQWLIEHRAAPNERGRDGNAPIHSAVFFGRSQTLKVLLDADADVTLLNKDGTTVRQIADVDLGMTQGVGRMFGINVEREELAQGRAECIVLLDAKLARLKESEPISTVDNVVAEPDATTNAAAEEKTEGELATKSDGDLDELIVALTMWPVFHHLWFLWFLCWLVAAFAVYALVMNALELQSLPRVLVTSWWRFAWLIPLTWLAQSAMGKMYPVFGPDTSIGILPMPHVMFYYAIFFGYGALYFDSHDKEGAVGRYWQAAIVVGLLVFPLGYDLVYDKHGLSQMVVADWRPWLSIGLQTVYTWCMTFGLMGLFRATMSSKNGWMRYISDSSYWLYLMHMPLVIVGQAFATNWALPAFVKFTIICAVVTAFLLLTYEFMVRYTFIGAILNGRKKRPSREEPVVATRAT